MTIDQLLWFPRQQYNINMNMSLVVAGFDK